MAALIWLVILAAIGWFLFGGGLAALSASRRKVEPVAPEDRLRYAAPEGQDPAALMAVLAPAGYVARLEEQADTRVLVIVDEDGERPDRGAVRALIAQTGTTIQDPALTTSGVSFLDEGPQR